MRDSGLKDDWLIITVWLVVLLAVAYDVVSVPLGIVAISFFTVLYETPKLFELAQKIHEAMVGAGSMKDADKPFGFEVRIRYLAVTSGTVCMIALIAELAGIIQGTDLSKFGDLCAIFATFFLGIATFEFLRLRDLGDRWLRASGQEHDD